MKRVFILLCCLSLVLCSCGEPKLKDFMEFKESSEKVWENGLSDSDTVLTVDGYNISYSELRYYMEVLDADKSEIEEKVLPEILQGRRIALLAKDADITLTDDEYKNLTDYLNETAEDPEYEKQLELGALTDSLFRFIALQSQLTAKVYEHYTNELTSPVKASDDDIIQSGKNGELIRVKHILIKVDDKTPEPIAKAEAEKVLEKLKNGENMDDLIKLHSDYTSANEVGVGEYIYRYEMPKEFSDVAFSLEIGKISDIVYVDTENYTGYHIIQRVETDTSYIEKNLDVLRKNYMTYKFYESAYANIENFDIEYTDNFNKV